MTTGIMATLDGLVDALRAEGLRASVEPRDLNAPCAWVTPSQTTTGMYLCGDGELRVDVYLIAPDHGYVRSLQTLEDSLAKALQVIEPDEAVSLAESVVLPDSPNPLPAFLITVKIPVDPTG